VNAVDIIRYFESKYPTDLAYEWDNCGLQIGTLNLKTKKVLITLDVTKDVVKEAIKHKVQLIISHHPLMFKPMQTIIFDSPRGWIVKNLIQHNIAVYSAHTNFDVADGGMNDILASKLGLSEIALLDDENNNGAEDGGETSVTKDIRSNYPGVTLSASAHPIFYPRGTAWGTTVTLTNTSGSKSVSVSTAGRVKIQ